MASIDTAAATGPLDDEWAAMTFPAYRPLLLALGPAGAGTPAARVARDGSRPAGLVLAQPDADDPTSAELLSMFVAADLRGRGIATSLLAGLEADLARRGFGRIAGVYMSGKSHVAALERIFCKRGFEPPVRRRVAVQFLPEEPARARWYQKARMPGGSEIFAWTELTAAELEGLKRSQAERGWIPPALEPWSCDQNIDTVSSVGMRKDGDVVGWVINHRMRPDLVAFTISHMRPDLARRGAIFPLYVAALQRLQGTGVLCSFVTDSNFASMQQFVLKHVAPYVRYCGETLGVSKALGQAPGGGAPA